MCRVVFAVICFVALGSFGFAATSFQNQNPFATSTGESTDAPLLAPNFSATESPAPRQTSLLTSAPPAPSAPVALEITAGAGEPLASSALPSQTTLNNLPPVFVASGRTRSTIPEILTNPATPLASTSPDTRFSHLLNSAREYSFEIVLGIALLAGMAWLCYLSPLSANKNHAG